MCTTHSKTDFLRAKLHSVYFVYPVSSLVLNNLYKPSLNLNRSDVDPQCLYPDPDPNPQNLMNADPDPSLKFQFKMKNIIFLPMGWAKTDNNYKCF